jgi:hypothetical protein
VHQTTSDLINRAHDMQTYYESSGKQSGRVAIDKPTTPSSFKTGSYFSFSTSTGACVFVKA